MVETPKALALAPVWAHGDTADRPSPTPSNRRIRDSAAAPAAPAKMAPQDTALGWAGARRASCDKWVDVLG